MPDINCDMGEGMGNEKFIMPYITSANIACGYHAGDEDTMRQILRLAIQYNVHPGAHPSFNDRVNFGRKEMDLPSGEISELVLKQLEILNSLAASFGKKLHHVKPHGALYNMSARDPRIASAIASAVHAFDPDLVLYGLANSHSLEEARKAGLMVAGEAFADRKYNEDGSLVSRQQPDALIMDKDEAVKQALLLSRGQVNTIHHQTLFLEVDTICIHGDGPRAVEFAKAINEVLKKED